MSTPISRVRIAYCHGCKATVAGQALFPDRPVESLEEFERDHREFTIIEIPASDSRNCLSQCRCRELVPVMLAALEAQQEVADRRADEVAFEGEERVATSKCEDAEARADALRIAALATALSQHIEIHGKSTRED